MVSQLVLRMKKRCIKIRFLAASLLLAVLFCLPYLLKDLLPIEHDTFFHLSRIEGLARSISEGSFLPAVYPYKNNGFGYASPLFYCDLFLIPAALLCNAGLPLSVCYKLVIVTETVLASFSLMCCAYRITHSVRASVLAAAAYTFANYHITDVYVRGALGEVQAMIFLPMLLEGIYILLYEQKEKEWRLCAAGLTGLALTHNLTFLLAAVLCVIFFLVRLSSLGKKDICAAAKAVVSAFLLSAFFTLPMLEQLKSDSFYLNYYGSSSDLASGAMPFWKYFANATVFGYSDTSLPHDQQMLVNPGLFLTFVPLLYLLKKDRQKFITHCLILGYVFLLLPCSLIPWDALSFLRILQFPWRLIGISMVLLAIPAGIGFISLVKNRILQTAAAVLILSEGIWHVMPVTERTFGMTSDMTWSDVTEGALCDPYYSATYMRVELAGGDYLPLSSPDYRTLKPIIMDSTLNSLDIPCEKKGTELSFSLSSEDLGQQIVLPLTWYKGYHVYLEKDGRLIPVACTENSAGLVTFEAEEAGTYICRYESTPLRRASILISAVSLAVFTAGSLIQARKKKYE